MRGFDRAAETYERGRPDYPTAAVELLGRALHLRRGTTVVELGSGTGKFTRALAPLGAARVAVEPTAGMRRVFARIVPEVPVLAGTAEAIPLPDRFADAVVAAQAFHWFDPTRAFPEIARVLRPGGGLGLVWNYRDEPVAWSRRLTEIVDEYRVRQGVPRASEERWRAAFGWRSSPFEPLRVRSFPHIQRASRRGFVSRILSISAIAVLPATERRVVADRVREVLDGVPPDRPGQMLEMPYRTEVYWTRVREGARRHG